MKKVLAIILTVVMLFGVIAISTSADEATPTVKIITNEGSPVEQGVTTYFTVRFDNFSSIKGIDVTVSADEKIVLGEVDVTGFDIDKAEEGVNYTESNEGEVHTIRFVDLTGGTANGKIIFAASVPKEATDVDHPTITVSGKYADSGKTLFNIEAPAAGTFELTKAIVPAATESETKKGGTVPVVVEAKKFVPQGAVYYKDGDDYVFATKDKDGYFIADQGAGNYVYQSYDIPANGITTFGASDDPEDNTRLRFGSYSKVGAGNGTMVFEGDWLALKNHYIKQGYTVQQFTKAIYNSARTALEGSGKNYVYYMVPTGNGDEKTQVNVYLFAQTKYMWTNMYAEGYNPQNDALITEYAIRLDGIKENTTYTAVAYCNFYDENGAFKDVELSEDVKSVSK